MPKMKSLVVAIVMLLAPGLALAQVDTTKPPPVDQSAPLVTSPKWSYFEGGYIDFNAEDDFSDDGFFAGGSLGLLGNFHVIADYQGIGDRTFWNAGAGWHGLLGAKADLFAQVMYARVEYDDEDIDHNGYDLQAGVRWKLLQWLEINGQANWADYGDGGDEATGEAGVLGLFLNDRIGVGANFEVGDSDRVKAFLRFNFGR